MYDKMEWAGGEATAHFQQENVSVELHLDAYLHTDTYAPWLNIMAVELEMRIFQNLMPQSFSLDNEF